MCNFQYFYILISFAPSIGTMTLNLETLHLTCGPLSTPWSFLPVSFKVYDPFGSRKRSTNMPLSVFLHNGLPRWTLTCKRLFTHLLIIITKFQSLSFWNWKCLSYCQNLGNSVLIMLIGRYHWPWIRKNCQHHYFLFLIYW